MEEEIVLMEENDIEEIDIEEENYSGKPYELPIASKDVLGGIKVGNNLTIDEDGTLNAQAGGSGDIEVAEKQNNMLTASLPANVEIAKTNTAQLITSFVELTKVGDKFSVENGVIKVGAGVSKVKLSYSATCQSTVSKTRTFTYIAHNREVKSQESFYFTGTETQITVSIPPILLDVKEGDTFTLFIYGVAGNRLLGHQNFKYQTHMTIEEYHDDNLVIAKGVVENLDEYAKKSELPTKVSELENDSKYLTSIPLEYITETELSEKKYVTESFVTNKIAEAELSGGDVDLSGYATKDELNNKVDKVKGKSLIDDTEIERLKNVTNYDDAELKNQINSKATINDMTTYIENHKSELKGDKGEQGIQGLQGEKGDTGSQGPKGDNGYTPVKGTDYWTQADKEEIKQYVKGEIPTKISELTNDSNFITSIAVNSIMVVDTLPETEVEGVLYLVKEVVKEDDGNLYDPLNAPVLNAYISTGSKVFATSENEDKSTYLQIEPNTTYKITKLAGAKFSIGTCPEEPSSYTNLTVAQKNENGSEQTITSGSADNYLAIFYYTEGEDTLTEEELRNSITVTKVS